MKDDVFNKNFLKPTNENLERSQGKRGVDSDYQFSYGDVESPQITFNAHLVPPATSLDVTPPVIVQVTPLTETFLGLPYFNGVSPSIIVQFSELVENANDAANYVFGGPAQEDLLVTSVLPLEPVDGGTRVEIFFTGDPKPPGFLTLTVGGAGSQIVDAAGNSFAGDQVEWYVEFDAPEINAIVPPVSTSVDSAVFNWKIGIGFDEFLPDRVDSWRDTSHYTVILSGSPAPDIVIPVSEVNTVASEMYEYGYADGSLSVELVLDSSVLDSVSDEVLASYKTLQLSWNTLNKITDRALNPLNPDVQTAVWGWVHQPSDTFAPTSIPLSPNGFCEYVPQSFIDPATSVAAVYGFDYVIGFDEAVIDGYLLDNWSANADSGYAITSVTKLTEGELSAYANPSLVEAYRATVQTSVATTATALNISHNLTDSAGNTVSPAFRTYEIDTDFVTFEKMSQSQANYAVGEAEGYDSSSFVVDLEFTAPIKTMSSSDLDTFWGKNTALTVQALQGSVWVEDTSLVGSINSVAQVTNTAGQILSHRLDVKIADGNGQAVLPSAINSYRIVFAPNPTLSNGNEATAPMPYGFTKGGSHMGDPNETCAGFGNPLTSDPNGTTYSNDWSTGTPLYFTVATAAPAVQLISITPALNTVVDNNQNEFVFQYSGTVDSLDLDFYDGEVPITDWTVDMSDPTAVRVEFLPTFVWQTDIDVRISVNNGDASDVIVWSLEPKDMDVQIISHTKNGASLDIEVSLGDDATEWVVLGIYRGANLWWENNDISSSTITETTATLPVGLTRSGEYKIYVASVENGAVAYQQPLTYRVEYQYDVREMDRIQKDWSAVDLSAGNTIDHLFGPNVIEVLFGFGADCTNPVINIDYGADGDSASPVPSITLTPSLSPYSDFSNHELYYEPNQAMLDNGQYAQGALVTIPISSYLFTLAAGATGQVWIVSSSGEEAELYAHTVTVERPSAPMLQLGRWLKSPFPSSVTPSSDPYSLRVYKLDGTTGAPEVSPTLTLTGFKRPIVSSSENFLLYGNFYWVENSTDINDQIYGFQSEDPSGSIQNLPLGRYVVEQLFPMSEWEPVNGLNEGSVASAYHLVDIKDMGVADFTVENLDTELIKVSFTEPAETSGILNGATVVVGVDGGTSSVSMSMQKASASHPVIWEAFTAQVPFSPGDLLVASLRTEDTDEFHLPPENSPDPIGIYESQTSATASDAGVVYNMAMSFQYESGQSYVWRLNQQSGAHSWGPPMGVVSERAALTATVAPMSNGTLPPVVEWVATDQYSGQLYAQGVLDSSGSVTLDRGTFYHILGIHNLTEPSLSYLLKMTGKDANGNVLAEVEGLGIFDTAAPYYRDTDPITGALHTVEADTGTITSIGTTGTITGQNIQSWTTVWSHRDSGHPSYEESKNALKMVFEGDPVPDGSETAVVVNSSGISTGLVNSGGLTFANDQFGFTLQDPRQMEGWRVWANGIGWSKFGISSYEQLFSAVIGVSDAYGNAYNVPSPPYAPFNVPFNVQKVGIPFFVDAHKTETSVLPWVETGPFQGVHYTSGASPVRPSDDVFYDSERDMLVTSSEVVSIYSQSGLQAPDTPAYKDQLVDKGLASEWREVDFTGDIKFALELHYSEAVPSGQAPKLIPEVLLHSEHLLPLIGLQGNAEQAFAGVLYPLRLEMTESYISTEGNDYGKLDLNAQGYVRFDQTPYMRLTEDTVSAEYNFYESKTPSEMDLDNMWVDRGSVSSEENIGHVVRVGFSATPRFADSSGQGRLSVSPIGNTGRFGIPLVLEIRTKPYYSLEGSLNKVGADFVPVWLVFDEDKEVAGFDFMVLSESGSLHPLGEATSASPFPYGRSVEFQDADLAYRVLDDGFGIKVERPLVVLSNNTNSSFVAG